MGLMLGVLGEGGVRECFVLVRTRTEDGFKPHICSPMYYGAAYFCVPVAAITKIMEGVCYNRKMEFVFFFSLEMLFEILLQSLFIEKDFSFFFFFYPCKRY